MVAVRESTPGPAARPGFLAHATGRYLAQQRPIRLKRHGRRAQSVFRLGLDHLRQVLLQGFEQRWQALQGLFLKGALGPAPVPI